MGENLTPQDKAILLGVVDAKGIDDYDHEFYETMLQVSPLSVEEVDDRVRRAIVRYTTGTVNGGFVMMGFMHGYMVGRKLKRDITRKP